MTLNSSRRMMGSKSSKKKLKSSNLSINVPKVEEWNLCMSAEDCQENNGWEVSSSSEEMTDTKTDNKLYNFRRRKTISYNEYDMMVRCTHGEKKGMKSSQSPVSSDDKDCYSWVHSTSSRPVCGEDVKDRGNIVSEQQDEEYRPSCFLFGTDAKHGAELLSPRQSVGSQIENSSKSTSDLNENDISLQEKKSNHAEKTRMGTVTNKDKNAAGIGDGYQTVTKSLQQEGNTESPQCVNAELRSELAIGHNTFDSAELCNESGPNVSHRETNKFTSKYPLLTNYFSRRRVLQKICKNYRNEQMIKLGKILTVKKNKSKSLLLTEHDVGGQKVDLPDGQGSKEWSSPIVTQEPKEWGSPIVTQEKEGWGSPVVTQKTEGWGSPVVTQELEGWGSPIVTQQPEGWDIPFVKQELKELESPVVTKEPKEPKEWGSPVVAQEPEGWGSPFVTQAQMEWGSPIVTQVQKEWGSPAVTQEPKEWGSPAVTQEPKEWGSPAVTQEPKEWGSPAVTQEPKEWGSPFVMQGPKECSDPIPKFINTKISSSLQKMSKKGLDVRDQTSSSKTLRDHSDRIFSKFNNQSLVSDKTEHEYGIIERRFEFEPSQFSKIVCNCCGRVFCRYSDLERHKLIVHNQSPVKRFKYGNPQKRAGLDNFFDKGNAPYSNSDVSSASKYQHQHTENSFHGKENGAVVSNLSEVNRLSFSPERKKAAILMYKYHNVSSRLCRCWYCNQGYARKSDLESHIEIHETKKSATEKEPKKIIVKAHGNCEDNSNRKCSSLSNLTDGKGATHKDLRKTSLSKSCKYKIMMCEICRKKFSSSGLALHVGIHTGERPYRCPHCPRRYVQKGNRDRHVHDHHAEDRPYPCSQCSRRFQKCSQLKLHVRLHSQKMTLPFCCHKCQRGYRTQVQLQHHNCWGNVLPQQ